MATGAPPTSQAPADRPGDRIGYARVSSRGQDLETQERLLRAAGCVDPLYVETISTRQPERPRFIAAVAALRPGDILTVTMLDRLGRNLLGLITSAQDVEHRGNRLEILQGPLAGIYDPRGAGRIVFATFAAFAEAEHVRAAAAVLLDKSEAHGAAAVLLSLALSVDQKAPRTTVLPHHAAVSATRQR